MKEEQTVTKIYIINGFKAFSQFAVEYFPSPSGVTVSRRRMREKIDQDLSLTANLKAAGYTEHTINLTPKMQEIIVLCWGPPEIVITIVHPGPEE